MITYNHVDFIAEAIEGVLMQDCKYDLELIIADDCSPDKTSNVVEKYIKNHTKGNCIKYFQHNVNIGMINNFKWALEQCQGEYIALCEGDDYWTDPLKLQKQVDFLESNKDYVLCFHKINILNLNGSIVEDFITKVPVEHETFYNLASFGNYIHTPSVVFRNILSEFPKEFEISPVGDYFLYMLLAQHGKIKYISERMAIYRQGVGIWSGKSYHYKYFNGTYVFALLTMVFNDDKRLFNIFSERIKIFLIESKFQITVSELEKLFVNNELKSLILDFYLKKYQESINLININSISYKSLIIIMFKRIISKIKNIFLYK
jgi:glycosyltransferase involved in cell wall biosynthesis